MEIPRGLAARSSMFIDYVIPVRMRHTFGVPPRAYDTMMSHL